MNTLGGGPLSDVGLAGTEFVAAAATDNISLTAVDETNTVIALTIAQAFFLDPIDETNEVISPNISIALTNAQLFSFPVENGYQTEPLLAPGWTVHILDEAGENPVDVVPAASGRPHAYPVKVDRIGQTPTMYINGSLTYRVKLKNEFGVTKYDTGYTWPNTLEKRINLTPLDETNTVVELTTSEP